jgi:hypothetical protein
MTRPVRITGARITPVAFADPPLLNSAGVHEPYALRAGLPPVGRAGIPPAHLVTGIPWSLPGWPADNAAQR